MKKWLNDIQISTLRQNGIDCYSEVTVGDLLEALPRSIQGYNLNLDFIRNIACYKHWRPLRNRQGYITPTQTVLVSSGCNREIIDSLYSLLLRCIRKDLINIKEIGISSCLM